jgi:hypothetical protein
MIPTDFFKDYDDFPFKQMRSCIITLIFDFGDK